MLIRFADLKDFEAVSGRDKWITSDMLEAKLKRGEVFAAFEDGGFVGWLRYGFFWDEIPFINMLRVEESLRGRGIGRALVLRFEEEMRAWGYGKVMTSTAQDEYAQHFYLKLGYKAAGGFTPLGEPYELLFVKEL